jgi:ABC-type nitrate/sulfonate/bicarbonate transport system substrate-binding protein
MSQNFSRRDVLLGGSAAALTTTLATSMAGSLLGSGSAFGAAPAPVAVANAAGGLNLTMTAVMKRMKFMESFGLDPNFLNVADGSRMLGAILNGSLDVSLMSGLSELFPAMEHGAAIKIIAASTLTPTIALFTGKPDIKSLKDLEGHVIGTGSIGALTHQIVVTLLRKYNVDISKIRFVNVGSSADIFRAVSQGTVDAGPAAAALISQADHFKVRLVPQGNMAEELRGYTFQGSWCSAKKLESSRDLIVKSMAAQAKLYRFVQTPAGKGPFIEARQSVFPSQDASDHQAEWDFIQSYKPFATDLVINQERVDFLQKMNVEFKMQGKVLPYEQITDMSIARDAVKLLS